MTVRKHARPESPARTQGELRVLVVRIGAMGDVLHGLPAIAALRQALPGCFVGWAVEPHWAPLLQSATGKMPLVDYVHPVPTRAWRGRPFEFQTVNEIKALARDLKSMRYDVCVDLQGSIKSAVVGSMARAPRFFGPARPRERAARALYKQAVAPSGAHVIQHACELVSAATGLTLQAAPVVLPADADAEGWCSGLLARFHITTPFVLLAPAAGWGAKQWGSARFGEVARNLCAAGYPVLVNASAQDAEAAETAKAGGATMVVCTLPQLISLTRRAALVLGGDTGPVHLGAALGRPVLALFGPTDPARNGPSFPGANAQVLRHPQSGTSHKRSPHTEAGLAQLTVAEVTAAALAMLGGSRHG